MNYHQCFVIQLNLDPGCRISDWLFYNFCLLFRATYHNLIYKLVNCAIGNKKGTLNVLRMKKQLLYQAIRILSKV